MTPWDLPKNMRDKVAVVESGCWLWTGARQSRGYGCGGGKAGGWLAHRRSYELLVGPIPSGLTIDHLCMVKHCINPAHLEPVTSAENTQRAALVMTAEPNYPCGHPRSDDNTVVKHRGAGRTPNRYCRECARAARMDHYRRTRKAAA